MRELLVQTRPWLRTRRPDVQHRRERGSIIERGEPDRRELRVDFALREQGRATVPAKPARRHLSAAGTDRVSLRTTGDLEIERLHDDTGGERSPARTLAIAAMAVQHGDGLARALVADRAAGASAGDG